MVSRLLLVLSLLSFPASAQQPPASQDALGVYDGQGSFYAVTTRFGPSYTFIHVVKIDSRGGVIWQGQFAPSTSVRATSIALDRGLNLIVVGTAHHGDHFDPVVLKYTARGQFLGHESYEARTTLIPAATAIDSENSIYIAGCFGDASGTAVRLIKFSSSGGVYWAQDYRNGEKNYVRGLASDMQGNVALTVESSQGGRYGTYAVRTTVYHRNGGIVSAY